ncbi:hypothetical protein [Mycobacterium paraintracellulare]|uniref:hypothetical protein n=1 Tax=Mycobacterium paraintracellulare TaxID=1138383 RepID=UPI0019153A96|nr:hypothetical protein [Mycobacterium paraintracellulare]
MSDNESFDDSDLHEFDLDDPLLRPPDGIAEPLVDPQLEDLPTDRLSWENFERLLLRVAEDVRGLRNVRRFGTAGQAQKGLDVIGINSDGKAEGIQSKRRKTFTKTDLDDAVKKYTDSTFSFPFARLAVGVSKQVAERKIVEQLIGLNVALAPLEVEIWDQDALSRMLRPYPQIVLEFFGPATATRFCGEHTLVAPEVVAADAVATADAVMRGPLTTVGGYEKLKAADAIVDDDPHGALELYRVVQARLTAAGFPGHAAEFDERIAHLLVATGSENDAIALIMERLWVAERADDSLSAQIAARTLKSLAGLPDFGPARPEAGTSPLLVAAAQVAEFVAENLHQPVPTQLDLPTDALAQLSPGDRAQTVLFAAERALSNDDLGWLERHAQVLSDCVSEAGSSHEDVALRIELAVADVTGKWNELLHRARTATRRDLGALTLARYARYAMWHGDYVEANQAWGEAINHACLALRHEDAAEWLYSQRFVMNRHVSMFEDSWHPLARSLSDLPSRPRLVTSTSSSRENALAALHRDEKRSAAIHLRRYLCDAIRSGSLNDEIDARMLLGGLYSETNQPKLAARQLVLARDYEAARSVTQDLGDSYLDVSDLIASPVSWVVATSFEFVAAEADLVPDASVDALIDSALSAIDDVNSAKRVDSPIFSPQITLSAYRMIGELSERLNDGHAAAVLEHLSGHVTAEEHHYRMTDESHVHIAAGIATTKSGEVNSAALDHLIGLFARHVHPFTNYAKDALRQNLGAVQPRLQELADGGHHDARAFLATADQEHVDSEQAVAAADRLQKPTGNSLGRYSVGTRAIDDSLLARSLSPAQRTACIDMLLQNARSPFEGSSNRQTYFLAAANLSGGLDEEQRRKVLADIVDFIGNPPPSQPDMLNASMTNPLGAMRWDGNLDSRPAAVLAAAFFAKDADEKNQVRDLAFRLIGVAGEQGRHLADALQVIKADLNEIAPLLAQAGWAMRSIAAIAWAKTPSMPPELGERLSKDPDARVRRTLATAIRDSPSTHPDQIRAVLQADPRWSVRSILS